MKDNSNYYSKYYNNLTSKEMDFFISEDYNLSKEEENKLIYQINQLLNQFNKELDLLSYETTFYSLMPLGRKICENILKLIIKKEGYYVTEYVRFVKIVQFCKVHDFIPKSQFNNLNIIREYANASIHGMQLSNNNSLSFLKAFNEFIKWFDSLNYKEPSPLIEEINSKINFNIKLLKDKDNTESEGNNKLKKYSFYKKEEDEDINQINKLLNDYEKQLKLISDEKKFYYIFTGSTITELMLKLLIKKEGYFNPNDNYTFFSYIETLYQNNIIPRQCYEFLHLIRRYRNEFIHGEEQSNKVILSFLNAFNYFIQWFDNYYSITYEKEFQIEECCELINSLTYDKENKTLIFIKNEESYLLSDNELKINKINIKKDINKLKEEIKYLENNKTEIQYNFSEKNDLMDSAIKNENFNNKMIKELELELQNKEKLYQKQINELKNYNNYILKKLDENTKLFEKCIELLEENNSRGERIENKINDLYSKLDTISSQNKTIQTLTERLIENADSKEEIERLTETYIDECIDNIMQHSLDFTHDQNFEIEKKKLIYSIGENGWNKLLEKSKTFLITSKVMYNHLITMDDIIDYSGICVLVTKALEVELHKRFFTNFLEYLNEKYGKNYKKYHTALLYQKRKPLLSDKLTMGDIAFVMCYTENWNDSDEEKLNNKSELMEYCKKHVFSKYNENEIDKLLNKYASSIEVIRKKYRNPSAHTNEIKRIDAEECFNLVLDVEKLLKQMLDSFDT